MAILKCKMCGGQLSFEEGATVCECEYCGSKQTIPAVDDEKKITLYERANRLRFNSEFDKAASVYENIVADFTQEAEAYWGLVLCRYGIEYVDDPATGKKVPTCHRLSFDSVMDDSDFEMVMENADSIARNVYREQAKQIEEIRKGIVEISGKEAPYDIFICYKETAEDGQRTIDSVLAQDVYDALTAKGYRVFFSRITLEDKLGTEYEPYIFAALNSAKVMLAFGSSYDYYNAVWVKNEWSRYLKLMSNDREKHLIPCYKDIDAYDIPKEFAMLQAQDMDKIGAMQDLLRGIEKLIGINTPNVVEIPQPVVIQQSSGPNVKALLQRGFNALEDGDFDAAKDFFNRVLDSDANCAEGYLGLFMADIEASIKQDIKNTFEEYPLAEFSADSNYKRAKQYANEGLSAEIEAWEQLSIQSEIKRNEIARIKDEERLAEKRSEEERKKEIEILREEFKTIDTIEIIPTQEESPRLESLKAAVEKAQNELNEANSNYTNNPLYIELSSIERAITEKEAYLATLGIFNVKEIVATKKQIDRLNKAVQSLKENLDELISVISVKKNNLESVQKELADSEHCIRTSRKVLIMNRLKEVTFSSAKVGSTVFLGQYEQGSGVEPIEWQILAKENNKMLVISKLGLDCKPYNADETQTSWENCTLRAWLNNEFLNGSFSLDERAIIMTANVCADKNPECKTNPGNSTKDKVFLLSIKETKKYFVSNDARKCEPTAYAKANGVFVGKKGTKNNCHWLLRSPGRDSHSAAFIGNNGIVVPLGLDVTSKFCIRPAMWVDLEYYNTLE